MRQNSSTPIAKVLPVLFGFFVMGFVDVVGTLTAYAKQEFNLSETLANFIPSMIFIWFLLLSVPTAALMNRLGRKKTVQLSNVITIIGMIIPFITFDFHTCMLACILLGIGNTILQVSLNPLLTNVVKGDMLTSSLTAGQVVKAVSAVCAPFIALFATKTLGNWQYIFPIYALITIISAGWLMATPIKEETPSTTTSSLGNTFRLLSDRMVLLCFIGILFVVGVDVGMNTVTPKLLIERVGMDTTNATLGISVYSLCRTIGALIGAAMLLKMADMKYYKIHIYIALVAIIALFFAQGEIAILALVGIIGYTCSSIFSVIFSQALKARPEKANEISGLMVTGICGGAIIPPVMGALTDNMGSQIGSVLVITICILYLVFFSLIAKTSK